MMKTQSRIAFAALSLSFLLISKIAISQNDAAFRFSKPDCAEVKMVVDGFFYIDVEDFDHYGGWQMDNQFVHLMGSPYLMATGVGKPVEDATMSFDLAKRGEFHVWVRDRNWVKEYAPGRFKVLINGKALDKEFGAAASDQWTWEYGGKVKLKKGSLDLALHDLTGYYGRCDAIILTDNANYTPPEDKKEVCKERARLKGMTVEPSFAGKFDVIVVGGGSAGVPAALAAARMGAKTALIQNRPVLGGNSSNELGVSIVGAGFNHPGWRETGIIEEAELLRMKSGQLYSSDAFKQLCDAEENLEVFFNQHVFDAIMESDKEIKGVKSVSTLTGKITEYSGTKFIDCTGDGWLGYFAGAEYRYGRESKEEFNENLAPDTADSITMSGCLMGGVLEGFGTAFSSKKTDKAVEFVRPPWAREIDTLIGYCRRIHQKHLEHGDWWMEHEGTVNDLWDAEEARDELIKVTFSFWDYVKNKSDQWDFADNKISRKEEIPYYELVSIPIMDAKRETRRLEGDYILTQHDVMSGRMFPDRIAYAGWPLDVHHPEGIYSGPEGSFEFDIVVPVNSIPFRSVYSRNIDNLLFAGRCGSFTHLGLGSVRVQSTLATIGQAAGTAAAMCIEKGINPRDIYKNHMTLLQQTLLKYDQSIPGLKNKDSKDLARDKMITASSNFSDKDLTPENSTFKKSLLLSNHDRSVLIPVKEVEKLNSIILYLKSGNKQTTMFDLSVGGVKKMGKPDHELKLGQYNLKIAANTKKWIEIPVSINIPEDVEFLRVVVTAAKGISWPVISWIGQATNTNIGKVDYNPENIINGLTRLKENPESLWVSDSLASFPQWIELDLGNPSDFNTVHLTFDTDLSTGRP
ncbi:MAG: FAD-dependent oxidoreductase, partial [Bacteroidetes bacterium]|nr:FAD-dependent oxidoreductase [Bacteroidota bacterium]